MSAAIVTGSSGLIGSETVKFLHAKGMEVFGIDNNMRAYFFDADGSTDWNAERLQSTLPHYTHHRFDIRSQTAVNTLFERLGHAVSLIVHCAAQPSHDWAAREPLTDFGVNALATMYLLEATRQHCPDATFIFMSTNKVYGDAPNNLPLVELPTRWELASEHPWAGQGIDETMGIDQSQHSIFGASKVAADVMCQEYGRYFGMKVGIFRGGCLTGPAHSGAELHGFLAYLVKCQLTERPYTIFGYQGKQVRDNIHSLDLVQALWHFYQHPRHGEVYNLGGSRYSNCSLLEAIDLVRELSGRQLQYTISPQARAGDHIWWISDVRKFKSHYPQWQYAYDIRTMVQEIITATAEREQIQL
jgi:CDP-paratose 2-epimerase